ncbi:MAG TPA: acetylxylan esterase [Planctomycetota bacterium]|nr:acetylxylan esterase [Planctomycetota bacterium]
MIRSTALALLLFVQEPQPAWQMRLQGAAKSPQAWKARQQEVRTQILVAAGLWPEFERPTLKPSIFGKVEGEGYTVERVHFETWPGFYVTGSLYRPTGKQGPFPGIVSPHGHWKEGRFTQTKDGNLPARGITFARLGFVCFMYDMVGYADSKQLPHRFEDPAWGVGLLGIQTFNSLRAVDFITSLPDVDPKRIGCTGASGGGTQTFILTAIDDRIACSVPVNMVAAEFQGGCSCENAPMLRLGLNNVEIAAMTAPRPLLLIAATGDWGKHVPTLEGPAIQAAYTALKVGEKFKAQQFNAPHNYNQDSREAVYAWMVRWLQNGPDQEKIAEAPFPPVKVEDLTIFTEGRKLPEGAVDSDGLKKAIHGMVEKQLAALAPKDGATLARFRAAMQPAFSPLFGVPWFLGPPRKNPGLERMTIVVCTKAEEAEPYTKGEGVQVVVLKPHEPETPAGGDKNQLKGYPTCFYRTPFAWQVWDVVDAIRHAQVRNVAIRLVAVGEAGLPALFARAIASSNARIGTTVIDLSAAPEAIPHPSMERIGGWRTAAMVADPGVLVLHGKAFDAAPVRAAYRAAGREGALTVSEAVLGTEKVLEILK